MNPGEQANAGYLRRSVHEMRQIQLIAVVVALLLTLAIRNATACESCFHECHDYTKTLKNLQEPDRSIVLGLWFGSFSTATAGGTTKRDVPEWAKSDEKIKQYITFWNTHIAHVPISKDERVRQQYRPHELEKIVLPLPGKDKAMFVHVATHHAEREDSYGNFTLSQISVQPAFGNKTASATLVVKAYLLPLKSIGGKMESGWGFEDKDRPLLFLEKTITIDGGGSLDLQIQERMLKELEKHKTTGYMGVVLQITSQQVPEEQEESTRLQLILSKAPKSQEEPNQAIDSDKK